MSESIWSVGKMIDDLKPILYENGNFFVTEYAKGFRVWRKGVTSAVLCATIGKGPRHGLPRAIQECNERQRREQGK